jgi:hypothetical protein
VRDGAGLDPVFLAEILLTHVVDPQTVGGSQFLGIGLDGVGQRRAITRS